MLITSDLHFTDRARDAYRWDIFPWLRDQLEHDETLLILGDLTDAKDNHSSALVNRIVNEIEETVAFGHGVFILKGNHDYVDAFTPFFGFLGALDRVAFIADGYYGLHRVEGQYVRMMPHTRSPAEDWERVSFEDVDLVLCHQTFNGAKASNGQQLQGGISARYFSDRGFKGRVISGDIHVPQQCGDVTYVGSPYPVAFGDKFTPRVLRVSGDSVESLEPPHIRKLKLTISDAEELDDLRQGDQVKLTVRLWREDFYEWERIRAEVAEVAGRLGVYVHSLDLEVKTEVEAPTNAKAVAVASAGDVLGDFCESRGLADADRKIGAALLKQVEE